MENSVKVTGTLKSVSAELKTNINGTGFYNCTVEYNGETYLAKVWQTVMEKGINLEDTVQIDLQMDEVNDTTWFTVIGVGAKIASASAFRHLFSTEPA